MTYRAPVADIAFALKHAAGMRSAIADGIYGELDEDTIDSVLEEAGKFASDVIAPLNRAGDTFGTPFKDGNVTMPPGWKEAYTSWAAAGWNGLASPADFGGQELPHAVNAACVEMWNAASMAFGIGPVKDTLRNIEATPRPPLRITVERSEPLVGGFAAASRISRATGMAVFANCL